jgi:pseudouridine synthase
VPLRYILLNKPARVVTTKRDPEGRPTVMGLLRGVREPVNPVGRLDYDTEGLLLLTNDGDLAARLTHPRHGILKVYRAEVLHVPDEDTIGRLRRGLVLDGERTGPAEVRLVAPRGPVGRGRGRDRDRAVLEIGIREGRNRQVRRMCEAVGHPVSRLERVAIGPLRDRVLKPGQWRDLTDTEVDRLRDEVG